jgi:hypothetical protein
VTIRRSDQLVSRERLELLAHQLLDASPLCAIATVAPRGQAHVNTAHFAWSPFELVWISDPRARHSSNVRSRGTAAVAVYDSSQARGGSDRGIQLFGMAAEPAGPAAMDAARVYARRFPDYRDSQLSGYRTYLFRPRRSSSTNKPLVPESS